jgi:hypothetical protein
MPRSRIPMVSAAMALLPPALGLAQPGGTLNPAAPSAVPGRGTAGRPTPSKP